LLRSANLGVLTEHRETFRALLRLPASAPGPRSWIQ
jgi:hypothetical protein